MQSKNVKTHIRALEARKSSQADMFPKRSMSYGGDLLKKRKNRTYARPISTSQSMHLVLRSSQAVGDQSFKAPKNKKHVQQILEKFAYKYGIQILSLANVGTHLHLHVKIARRHGYLCFIRAVTAAIAMRVSGRNRWSLGSNVKNSEGVSRKKFWDYRPFSRIIMGLRAFLNIKDYLQINQLEGLGLPRIEACFLISQRKVLLC